MNPFSQAPANSAGRRGYTSAAAAKAVALTQAPANFAVLQAGQEFAWVSPLELVLARLPHAMMRGITLVEMCQR
jgi:hypothetical protein